MNYYIAARIILTVMLLAEACVSVMLVCILIKLLRWLREWK